MSVRWMAVQYVGNTLRLPVVNDDDMDKPFGSSVLERDVKHIVVNPFSDSPQTFVPELENAKLRELVRQMHTCLTRPKVFAGASQPYLIATECPYFTQGVCDYNSCGFEQRMHELGIEVTE